MTRKRGKGKTKNLRYHKNMELGLLFGRNHKLSELEWEAVQMGWPDRFEWVGGGSGWIRLQATGLTESELLQRVRALQQRLGGTTRIIRLLETAPKALNHVELAARIALLIQKTVKPEGGKLNLGISLFGPHQERALRLAQFVKRNLTESGYSIRFVTARDSESLNAAQVKHNKLALADQVGEARDFEIIGLQEKSNWYLGLTLTVQDIAAYTKRDFGIPRPNAVSGMLPPKLAQIMINLALGGLAPEQTTVYDPFCGNGRVVLESAFLGASALGSDLVAEKVLAAKENLSWLAREFNLAKPDQSQLYVQDATAPEAPAKFFEKLTTKDWVMVGEPFLGPPLRHALSGQAGEAWLQEILPLYRNFFQTWAKLAPKPAHAVLVFPRARLEGGGEVSVWEKIVDRLAESGYIAKVLFCYDRPDALVRRDLVSIKWV